MDSQCLQLTVWVYNARIFAKKSYQIQQRERETLYLALSVSVSERERSQTENIKRWKRDRGRRVHCLVLLLKLKNCNLQLCKAKRIQGADSPRRTRASPRGARGFSFWFYQTKNEQNRIRVCFALLAIPILHLARRLFHSYCGQFRIIFRNQN